jgi:FtsZ-interacting cell division protein YlmF
VKCYNCNKKVHYSNDCPDKQPEKDKEKEKEKEKEKQKQTKDRMNATMMAEETSAYTGRNSTSTNQITMLNPRGFS